MEDKLKLMKEKVDFLNEASKAYYQESREIIPNIEYDRVYEELEKLEKETGTVLSGSPTVNVGYQILSDLPKEAHPSPMLSLDKTKEIGALAEWLGDKEGVMSWKIDGLTIVMTYEEGRLYKAVTRGNGQIGEVITNNAKVFHNIPVTIPYKGRVVLRGEAFIKYSDFEKINESIEDVDAKYKNPRNLCSGTVRQLNNEIVARRRVDFCAFALVEGPENLKTRTEQFDWMTSQGFSVVEHRMVTKDSIREGTSYFEGAISDSDMPSDGLVVIYNDITYGRSLGATSKFPRDAMAFKWQDEEKETVLKEIQWSASRTGLINPVAVFEPVELEGTTVTRASVHNVSILRELKLGIGDKVKVYKANMIIPQIGENITKSGPVDIPDKCPVCGHTAVIKQTADVEVLYCTNPQCLAKHLKSLTLFVSRNAMDIEGLSEATLEKFIARGFVKELRDIFRLDRYKSEIEEMEGMGEKSYANLIKAVNKARKTTAVRFLYSLGVPQIGVANARLICRICGDDWNKISRLTEAELVTIDGVGEVMAKSFVDFFRDPEREKTVADLLEEITLEKKQVTAEQVLEGKTFVITGSLKSFENRDALKEYIQERGGKASGSVSSKTDYLINNDIASSSSKNKKAKELGIPIITEEQFVKLMETGEIKNA